MAEPTKLELSQRLDAALKDNEALRLRVAQLEGTITALRNKLPVRSAYVPQVTPEQQAYREYQKRCREEAVAGGRNVVALSFSAWRDATFAGERVEP